MPGALRGLARAPLAVSDWIAAMQPALEFLREGAVEVHTPDPQAPALTTIIQLDGDTINYVSDKLFQNYPAPEDRAALLQGHLNSVRAALPRLPDARLAAWLLVGGATAITQGAALWGDLVLGSGLTLASAAHAIGLGPLGLRRFALRPLASLLRYTARKALQRERNRLRGDLPDRWWARAGVRNGRRATRPPTAPTSA